MEKNIHYQCFINMDDFLKTSAHLYMSMNKEHGSFIALKLRTMQYKGYLQFLAEWNEIPHSNKNKDSRETTNSYISSSYSLFKVSLYTLPYGIGETFM